MQVQSVRSYTPNFNGLGHRLVRISKMSEATKNVKSAAQNVADRFSKESRRERFKLARSRS